jgi:hypothetical protein
MRGWFKCTPIELDLYSEGGMFRLDIVKMEILG